MSESTSQWKAVYDRLDKTDVGDVTPYAALQALLPNTAWKGVVAAFHQARKRFVAQGIDFENVRGEGYRKIGVVKARSKATVAEKVDKAPRKAATLAKEKAPTAPKAVAFIAASAPASKPAKPLTSSQRIEALEAQVEFLTGRLEQLADRLKPATPAARSGPRKR